jgi:hypothetical protein
MTEFGDAYSRFIDVTARVATAAIHSTQAKRAVSQQRQQIEQLLNTVIRELNSHRSKEEIENAAQNLDPEVRHLLMRELDLISDMHEGGGSGEGVEDVETGKGSIEDILGDWLSDKFKHFLKILNQILKLVTLHP